MNIEENGDFLLVENFNPFYETKLGNFNDEFTGLKSMEFLHKYVYKIVKYNKLIESKELSDILNIFEV